MTSQSTPSRLGIIVSSARPNRIADVVSQWVRESVPAEVTIDLIDLAEVALPTFDGSAAPKSGVAPESDHHRAWAERIDALDAAVIVTPQYNGSYPGALKNAIDYLYAEWSRLPVLLVGYGWMDASEMLAHLEPLMRRLDADVVDAIGLGFGEDLSPQGELSIRAEKAEALTAGLAALRERLPVSV